MMRGVFIFSSDWKAAVLAPGQQLTASLWVTTAFHYKPTVTHRGGAGRTGDEEVGVESLGEVTARTLRNRVEASPSDSMPTSSSPVRRDLAVTSP